MNPIPCKRALSLITVPLVTTAKKHPSFVGLQTVPKIDVGLIVGL